MTEETPDQTRIEEQAAEQVEEKPLEQPHFDPEAEKKPTEGVKTEEKPEVNQEEKEKVKKEEMKQDERSAELKKAEANPEYMGNEMGEDILSIPLDDPVANAAASKIQVKSNIQPSTCSIICSRNFSEARKEKVSKTEFLQIVK